MNDFHYYDGKYPDHKFFGKGGEQWYFQPKRTSRSYTARVLDYLRDEWGLTPGFLTVETIEQFMDMADSDWLGDNVPNSAALVMEAMWQNGLTRPDFDTN